MTIEEKFAHLTRQLDIIPVDVLSMPVTVVGVGAVGSFLTLTLAKLGFTDITVYDFDKIDIENMNSQFFRFTDIGRSKVDALADLVNSFTGVNLKINNVKYVEQPLQGIVLTPLDSMEARKAVWAQVKDNMFVQLLIDPRMGAEYATCFAVRPNDARDQKMYESMLFSDAEAVQDPCTAKSTMYTVLLIAGHVSKVLKDFLVTGAQRYIRSMHWDISKNFQECRLNDGSLSGIQSTR